MSDLDIFSACLRGLLLENDNVTVPGLGCFMTKLMPASFSDRGRTINPPYRKLYFRTPEQGEDNVFANRLAAYLPEGSDVKQWLHTFISGFIAELERTKRVELAALGEMRATAQNDFFFVASDDLDIYPEGLGLEPVTIKSSQPEPEPVPVPEPVPAPEPEPVPEPEPESEPEPEPETKPEPQSEAKPRKKPKAWAVILIILAVLFVLALLAVIFSEYLPFGDTINDIIDHILYSEEELRLLNS